ncbi:MAG TPA: hypothetical protein PLW83_01715, partial [Deltaproteobacteria bacterium]|nr:hypothetical protein [Deltaproteobacteria bacterium]
GVALILVDHHGENMIAVASGANATLTPAHVEDAREAIQTADILLTQLEVPLATVATALDLARAFNLVPSGLNPSDVIVSGADAVFMDPLAFRRHGMRGWLRREEGSGKVRALCMPFLQGMHP